MPILAVIFIFLGTFFFFTATMGFLRFPDFYSRMHATGKSDTLGALLSLIGLALYNGFSLVSVKVLFIVLFIFLTSPTATHAILRAAFDSEVAPWTKDGKVVREAGEERTE